MTARARIGLTLVATRRPELLSRTLASFGAALFEHVDVTWVQANIDPAFGDAADAVATVALISARFPDAAIHQPETPGFGVAVKRVWSEAGDGPFLHLEDDWLANERIDVNRALGWLNGTVRAVTMFTKTHGTHAHGEYNERTHRHRFAGVTYRRELLPRFGLCPGFFDGDFARQAAALMDPALDPEKQMRRPFNRPLTDYVEQYRCRFLRAADGGYLVTDIGRDWQKARGIVKTVTGGRSTWTTANPPPDEGA